MTTTSQKDKAYSLCAGCGCIYPTQSNIISLNPAGNAILCLECQKTKFICVRCKGVNSWLNNLIIFGQDPMCNKCQDKLECQVNLQFEPDYIPIFNYYDNDCALQYDQGIFSWTGSPHY